MHMQQKAAAVAREMQQQCLGMRVGRLQRLVGRRFDQALRPLGLSVPQLEILSALALHELPCRPGELASLLSMDRSTMSRNLAAMASHGYVATTQTSPAGRSQSVAVTERGRRALTDAEAVWRRAQTEVAQRIGADGTHTLDGWLGALTDEA